MADQPNFLIIAEHLDAIKDEVALIPNIVPLTAVTFRQEMQNILGVFGAEIRAEIGTLRAEMRTEIGTLRAEMRTEIGGIRAEMGRMQEEIGGIRGEVGALRGEVGALRGEVGALRGEVGALRGEFRESQLLLPMRLHNATASDGAPLRYPNGVAVERGMPVTRRDVLTLSGERCQLTSMALGLPPLANPTVTLRRRQIADYLGVTLTD